MPVPGPAQLLPTGTRCTHVRAGLLLLPHLCARGRLGG